MDAVKLGAKRNDYAYGLSKCPHILKAVKANVIAIKVNPEF